MTTAKYPWESKTIVLNTLMAIIGAIAMFDPGISSVTTWLAANGPLIATVWSVLNVALRFITKDAIQLTD